VSEGDQRWLEADAAHNPKLNTYLIPMRDGTAASIRPVERKVKEITGIGEVPAMVGGGEGVREVEFTYVYDLPTFLRPYVVTTGTGKAVMRRFDDGWRIENVYHNDDLHPSLSASDLADFEAARKVAAEKKQHRIEESKKPGRLLTMFSYCAKVAPNLSCLETGLDGIVTDVSIATKSPQAFISGYEAATYHDNAGYKGIWFGECDSLHSVGGYGPLQMMCSNREGTSIYLRLSGNYQEAERIAAVAQKAFEDWKRKYGNLK
jgi:hypothetical protein